MERNLQKQFSSIYLYSAVLQFIEMLLSRLTVACVYLFISDQN